MKKITHASVFSGIGGPEVAAAMLGWENVFHCEINPFGRRVLEYWFPNSDSYEDIKTTDFTKYQGQIDVLTGGFPCQPFSYAGQRRGAEDDRYLWPHMFRCIDQIRPTWVVAENVAGILTMVEQGEVSKLAGTASLFDAIDDLRGRYELRETFTLQRICTDLESHGYAVQPVLVPACAVGAPHRRDRVFIVARRVTADTRSGGQSAPELESERERTQVQQQGGEQSQHGIGIPSASHAPTDSACGGEGTSRPSGGIEGSRGDANQQQSKWRATSERLDRLHAILRPTADTQDIGAGKQCECGRGQHREPRTFESRNGHWPCPSCEWDYCGERWQNFPSVSPVHAGNDGIPFRMDRASIPFGKWRTEALKAYGNAIVPQVMYEIFRAIQITEESWKQH